MLPTLGVDFRTRTEIGTPTLHKQATRGCHQQLVDEVITPHVSLARILVFVSFVQLDKETKEYKPLSKKSESKHTMLQSDLWNIGGQYTIEAMRGVMNDPNFSNEKDIKAYCSIHEIVVVVWPLDK